jgi:hypothetical protein
MSPPSNRYARAQARARYRKPKRRSSSMVWNVVIGVIVLLGIGGIIYSRTGSAEGAPEIGDHWHARLAVNNCGQFVGPLPEFEQRADDQSIRAGIHTHGDGFVHIHPFTSDEAGDDATIGTFLEFAGFDTSDDSLDLWDGVVRSNGDLCDDGRPGTVRFAVNGEEKDGDPSDYKPKDGDQIVIAFLPEGDPIPPPPEASQQQD